MVRVMSKRLRASMRAANKGRNLRPRASIPHPPPQDPRDIETVREPAAQAALDDLDRDSSVDEEAPGTTDEVLEAAPTFTDDPPPAATLRPDEIEERAALNAAEERAE